MLLSRRGGNEKSRLNRAETDTKCKPYTVRRYSIIFSSIQCRMRVPTRDPLFVRGVRLVGGGGCTIVNDDRAPRIFGPTVIYNNRYVTSHDTHGLASHKRKEHGLSARARLRTPGGGQTVRGHIAASSLRPWSSLAALTLTRVPDRAGVTGNANYNRGNDCAC